MDSVDGNTSPLGRLSPINMDGFPRFDSSYDFSSKLGSPSSFGVRKLELASGNVIPIVSGEGSPQHTGSGDVFSLTVTKADGASVRSIKQYDTPSGTYQERMIAFAKNGWWTAFAEYLSNTKSIDDITRLVCFLEGEGIGEEVKNALAIRLGELIADEIGSGKANKTTSVKDYRKSLSDKIKENNKTWDAIIREATKQSNVCHFVNEELAVETAVDRLAIDPDFSLRVDACKSVSDLETFIKSQYTNPEDTKSCGVRERNLIEKKLSSMITNEYLKQSDSPAIKYTSNEGKDGVLQYSASTPEKRAAYNREKLLSDPLSFVRRMLREDEINIRDSVVRTDGTENAIREFFKSATRRLTFLSQLLYGTRPLSGLKYVPKAMEQTISASLDDMGRKALSGACGVWEDLTDDEKQEYFLLEEGRAVVYPLLNEMRTLQSEINNKYRQDRRKSKDLLAFSTPKNESEREQYHADISRLEGAVSLFKKRRSEIKKIILTQDESYNEQLKLLQKNLAKLKEQVTKQATGEVEIVYGAEYLLEVVPRGKKESGGKSRPQRLSVRRSTSSLEGSLGGDSPHDEGDRKVEDFFKKMGVQVSSNSTSGDDASSERTSLRLSLGSRRGSVPSISLPIVEDEEHITPKETSV